MWSDLFLFCFTGSGSISNPVESTNPDMVMVGAARHTTPDVPEGFSSLPCLPVSAL